MGMEIPIPPGLKEDSLDHASEIIAKQFSDDPFQRYILLDDLVKAGKRDIEYQFNKEIFDMVIPGMVKDGAKCITVEGSGVASVWYVLSFVLLSFSFLCFSCDIHLFLSIFLWHFYSPVVP